MAGGFVLAVSHYPNAEVPEASAVTLLKQGTAQQTYRFGNGWCLRFFRQMHAERCHQAHLGPSYRSLSVTRDIKAADNRLFVSHGVVRLLNCKHVIASR